MARVIGRPVEADEEAGRRTRMEGALDALRRIGTSVAARHTSPARQETSLIEGRVHCLARMSCSLAVMEPSKPP